MRLTTVFIGSLLVTMGVSILAQQAPPPGPPPAPQDNGRLGPPPGQGRGGPGRGGPGRGGPGGPGRGGLDGFGPLRVPDSNPMTLDKITLGRALFFDVNLSADRTVSCATCHDPAKGFADGRAVARGVQGALGIRNTPTLVNAAYGREFFWDGRAATLEEQVIGPIMNPKEMALPLDQLQSRTGHSASDVAASLATYLRTIRSHDSRYDWYQAGQHEMLTDLERAGLDVFRGRGQCAQCHSGPNFTDDQFHVSGLGWQGSAFADEGRFDVTTNDRDHGAFKTPTLREVARTAPYMHDGSLATLEDVVDFYSRGGVSNPYLDPRMRPRRFSGEDKRALVAFLKALNGRVVEGY